MNNPLISIIIPVYNVEKYIKRCLDSIVIQSYTNFEIILVNDGSTDNSLLICDDYCKMDSRIKIISIPNGGVSNARNIGIDTCIGELITFIDADDWVACDYLEALYSALINNQADISCCGYEIRDEIKKLGEKKLDLLTLNKEKALDCYSNSYITCVYGKLYRKKIIAELRFDTNIYYSEDALFYTEACLKSKIITFINKTLYYYFINPKGAMHSFIYSKRHTDYIARTKIIDLYIKNGLDPIPAICKAFEFIVSLRFQAQQRKCKYDSCLNYWISSNRRVYRQFNIVNAHYKRKILLLSHQFISKIISIVKK